MNVNNLEIIQQASKSDTLGFNKSAEEGGKRYV